MNAILTEKIADNDDLHNELIRETIESILLRDKMKKQLQSMWQ